MRLNIPFNNLVRRREYHDYIDNIGDIATEGKSECNQCNHIFETAKALRNHVPTCQPNVFPCSKCGKNLATRNRLSSHAVSMHQNRKDIRKMEKR